MKTKLFFTTAFCFFFSLSLAAQTRYKPSDEPFVIYRVNEQQVKLDELSTVTDGKLEAFHNREKLYAVLKEGKLADTFSSTGFEGLFTLDNTFSVQDRKRNFARGEVLCSGMDTFKSFASYLVTPSIQTREELYKCLSFSKASYLDENGSYFLEGGLAFPILTKKTTLSFMPRQGLFPSFDKTVPLVKNVQFDLNEDVHQINVSYQFFDNQKIIFQYDFIESYLSKFITSPYLFLKETIWEGKGGEYTLKSFSLPSVTGKEVLKFEGNFHSKKGLGDTSKLSLFSSKEEKVAELSYLNESLFVDLKYPNLLTPFLEGEFKDINSPDLLSKVTDFISTIMKNPKYEFSDKEKALFLSGLEIKNLTLYDKDHHKKILVNLKFLENITESMIKQAQKDPKQMDLWVQGEVILWHSPQKEVKISFNNKDEVLINESAQNGKNIADLYAVIKHIQSQMKPSFDLYLSEIDTVINSIYGIGPLLKKMKTEWQLKNIMDAAHKIAAQNYGYCMTELENEKIDFMYDCSGMQTTESKGNELSSAVQISIPDPNIAPLIFSDKKTGKDFVYLTLKFKDKELCEAFAASKRGTCNQNEVLSSFAPNVAVD